MISGLAAGVAAAAAICGAAWYFLLPRTQPVGAIEVSTTQTVSPVVAIVLAHASAAQDATLSVVAVGDMLFDHGPRRLIAQRGGEAPLAQVAKVLADADVTVGNLEGPLSNRGAPTAGKSPDYIFEGDPRAVTGLSTAGFDLLSLANNHIMDHREEALSDTLQTLDAAGIAHAGAGVDRAAAWEPAIIERNGRRIAFLSFSQIVPGGFVATDSRPGMATGRDMRQVLDAVKNAKRRADYVIVSFHWGIELSYSANASQRRDAYNCIDAGADMVLSHHPHVLQEIEFYKGRLIAYSLGNFVFPYKSAAGRRSVILRATLGPKGVSDVRVTPVDLGGYGQPTIQTGRSATATLEKLRSICTTGGADVVIEGDSARVVPG